MRYQAAEIKAGAFVLLASAAFLGMFVWLSGYVDALLRPRVHYYTRLADAEGLAEGAVVHFAGIPAGQVIGLAHYPDGVPLARFESLKLVDLPDELDNLRLEGEWLRYVKSDERHVLVVFSLEETYSRTLGGGASIVVQQAIFGGASLNVTPGSTLVAGVAPGGYLPGEASTMAQIVDELAGLKERFVRMTDRIEAVLVNLDTMTHSGGSLARSIDNFEQLTGNLIGLSAQVQVKLDALLSSENIGNVEASLASLRSLVAELDRATSAHLEPTLARIGSLAGNLDDLVSENRQRVGDVLANAEAALAAVRTFSERLSPFLDRVELAIGDDQSGLLGLSDDLRGVIAKSDGLIDDLRRRVGEFRWSYLHYLLWQPDAAAQAASTSVDIARELVRSQEEMAEASARLDGLLRGGALDAKLRAELELRRDELHRNLERAALIQQVLFDRLGEGKR